MSSAEQDTLPDLVVFDMDRTLLDGRVAMAWADAFGVADEVRKVIDDRQQGRIDGIESARRIARLWKGKAWADLERLLEEIPLNPGAHETVTMLGEHGVTTAVLTDSYIQAAEVARRRVGADYAMGLILEEHDGRMTGEIRAPADLPSEDAGCEFSFLCKEKGVRALAKRLDARLERTVMIGDSDPDACAMEVTGRGIAYRPLGTRVSQAATHTVEGRDLRQVLEILGVPGHPKEHVT